MHSNFTYIYIKLAVEKVQLCKYLHLVHCVTHGATITVFFFQIMYDVIKMKKWWAEQREIIWRVFADKWHGGTLIFDAVHSN